MYGFSSTVDYGLIHVPKPGQNVYSAETYVNTWYEDTVENTVIYNLHQYNQPASQAQEIWNRLKQLMN